MYDALGMLCLQAAPVGASMVEDDTRLPTTLASGPSARRNVLGDWSKQSASVKTAPLDKLKSPPPTRPRRVDTGMAKIRVQETRLKKHKLLEALLKVSVRPVLCLAPH